MLSVSSLFHLSSGYEHRNAGDSLQKPSVKFVSHKGVTDINGDDHYHYNAPYTFGQK